MATQDNTFTATGTGISTPTADFLARTGIRSVRHGFLTAGRFSTGGSFSGRIRGVEGTCVERVGVYGQTGDPRVPQLFPPGPAFSARGTSGMASLGGRQRGKPSWAWRPKAPPL
jgi:hypothetical protein